MGFLFNIHFNFKYPMQYILTETEYQEILASKKQAHEFLTLKEQNSALSRKLEVADSIIRANRLQINKLEGLVAQGKQSIKERDQRIADLRHVCDLGNKKLLEQAHELLVKEAEIADLETKSRVLEETQKISDSRLKLMNQLKQKVRHLRAEHVCIAQNPKTGTTRVISAIVADTYRKFGWTVSEEFLVDRPA